MDLVQAAVGGGVTGGAGTTGQSPPVAPTGVQGSVHGGNTTTFQPPHAPMNTGAGAAAGAAAGPVDLGGGKSDQDAMIRRVKELSVNPSPTALAVATFALSVLTLYFAKPSVTLNRDDERSVVRIVITAGLFAAGVYFTSKMIR